MSPRLNNNLPPKTREKFDKISLRQSDDYWHGELFVSQPLDGKESSIGGNDSFVTGLQYQNFLNTTIREGVSTSITVPIKPADKIPTNNGTIRYRIIGGSKAPLSTQTKGTNTLEWMQNNRNIKLELEVALPDKDVQYFFHFTDPRTNQVEIVAGESAKKVSARTYYKTNEEPKIDHLSSDKEIVGQYIELTGALEVWLQNEGSGANLFINYTTEPVKPKNAKFMVLDIESMTLVNSIEVTSGGNAVNIEMIDKLNADLVENRSEFISDDWYLDLADPRDSLNGNSKKPIFRSTMSGELHNKFRIWDSLFVEEGEEGHLEIYKQQVIQDGENDITGDPSSHVVWGVMPGMEYVLISPGGPLTTFYDFNKEFIDCFRGGNDGNAPTPWYNDFSFFENVWTNTDYLENNPTTNAMTSNSFFIFDVIGRDGGLTQDVVDMAISNPNYNIKNPAYTEEDYKQFVRNALTGTVNINATTFTGWVNTLESTPKDDKIYNWDNSEENRKYIVLTPKIDEISRYKKLLENGGQFSKDNDVVVDTKTSQIVSKRHKFPTGDGSVDIHYDSNIWYDESYAAAQGWPINNRIVVSLGSEKEIDKVLLNIWAGIKYKLSFYDEKFKPAIGVDSNGIEKELPPTIVSAGNVDVSNDPLKSSVEIIYGLSSKFIL